MTTKSGLDRVYTVPNALSTSRIFLVGGYLALLFGPNDRVAAMIVLAIGGITDFADGYIARRFDQVTTIGKALDPIADRILLGAAITSMVVYGAVPLWLACVLLARESLVAATAIVLERRGARRIEVSTTGKVATFGLMSAIPLLLLGHGPGDWTHPVTIAGWVLVVPALVMSFVAAGGYVPQVRRALHERDLSAAS